MAKLVADWESLAKSYREIAYQRRAVVHQIWDVVNSNRTPEEQIDIVRMIAKSSGIYIQEEQQ